MITSNEGRRLIKNYEGLRLKAYKPVAAEKYWTIGYGHYGADVSQNMVITEAQAENYLTQDLKKFENAVNKLGKTFNQNQFDALVSFTYNCGAGSLNTLCRNRNNAQIAEALLLYCKDVTGKVLPGLQKRRKQERELFLKPVSQNTQTINEKKLPYKVKTKQNLNIRKGAGTNFDKIRVAKKGEILTVWAIETNGNTKWGKNGKEYFSLAYCEEI